MNFSGCDTVVLDGEAESDRVRVGNPDLPNDVNTGKGRKLQHCEIGIRSLDDRFFDEILRFGQPFVVFNELWENPEAARTQAIRRAQDQTWWIAAGTGNFPDMVIYVIDGAETDISSKHQRFQPVQRQIQVLHG